MSTFTHTPAGERDRRVTLQRRSITSDGAGGSVTTWVTIGTAWAKVSPGSGREFWAQRHLNPQLSHVINIRYRTDINPADRVIYNGRVFAISAIQDVMERRVEQELFCEETVIVLSGT